MAGVLGVAVYLAQVDALPVPTCAKQPVQALDSLSALPANGARCTAEARCDEDGWRQGRWYITAGLNPLFDTFDCQAHFFGSPEPGKLVGKITWRINRGDSDFIERSTTQKFVQARGLAPVRVQHDAALLLGGCAMLVSRCAMVRVRCAACGGVQHKRFLTDVHELLPPRVSHQSA
jgi:hypothetical protein